MVLQGQSWCCSQLYRVGSRQSPQGLLQGKIGQQPAWAVEAETQQSKGLHGYWANPCSVFPCIALKISQGSSSPFTFVFPMSVKYVTHARNLPEALPCFSHPSFLITPSVFSFLPVNIFQINPFTIFTASAHAQAWISIAAPHLFSNMRTLYPISYYFFFFFKQIWLCPSLFNCQKGLLPTRQSSKPQHMRLLLPIFLSHFLCLLCNTHKYILRSSHMGLLTEAQVSHYSKWLTPIVLHIILTFSRMYFLFSPINRFVPTF